MPDNSPESPREAGDDDSMTILDLIERCVERAASAEQIAGVKFVAARLRLSRNSAEVEQIARGVEFALATLLLTLREEDLENFCRDLSANAIRGLKCFNALIAQAKVTGSEPLLNSIDVLKHQLKETRH
jgi:hypothetical protein